MVKKFEGIGKPRLAATTSLFGLLGSQDEFLDPTGCRGAALQYTYDSRGTETRDDERELLERLEYTGNSRGTETTARRAANFRWLEYTGDSRGTETTHPSRLRISSAHLRRFTRLFDLPHH